VNYLQFSKLEIAKLEKRLKKSFGKCLADLPITVLCRGVLACLVLLFVLPTVLHAQCTGPGPDNFLVGGSVSSSDIYTTYFTRVVGPGTDSEFDGGPQGGYLLNWATYVKNGILEDTAWLSVGAWVFYPGYFTIQVNDHSTQAITFPHNVPDGEDQYEAFCIGFPSNWLKYPHRGAAPGVSPNSVTNTVQPIWHGPSLPPHVIDDTNAVTYSLNMKAMAPVILVHGYHSGPWWWGPSPSDPNVCGSDTNYPSTDTFDGGFDFVQALVDAKFPVTCAVQIPQLASIYQGAQSLETQIDNVAYQWVATAVHLVAHSKGGLWARAALPILQQDPNPGLNLYSLTTIDTPHHGSVLADLLVTYYTHPLARNLSSFPNDLRLFAAFFRRYTPSAENDMQTASLEQFNSSHADPTHLHFTDASLFQNVAKYYSVAADADLNTNWKIDNSNNPGNEGYPYHEGPSFVINNIIQNQKFQTLAAIQSVSVVKKLGLLSVVQFTPTPTPIPNDLTVTVPSAQFDGFTALNPGGYFSTFLGIPVFFANHKTIGCGYGSIPGCMSGDYTPTPAPISLAAPAVMAAIQDAEQSVVLLAPPPSPGGPSPEFTKQHSRTK